MSCEICGGSGVVGVAACSMPTVIHTCGPTCTKVRPVACGACEKAALSSELAG